MLGGAQPLASPLGQARNERRRALAVLAIANAVGSTGLAAGGTAGALLGAQLAGTDAAAGLPLGLLVLGSACYALVIARQARRVGRACTLAGGYLVGTAGAALVIFAAAAGSLAALLVGSLLLGGANASIFFARYAAAEVAGEQARGRALGLVLFATTVGAIASPLLLGPTGALAQAVSLPRLVGLFLVAAVAFALAGLILGTASHAAAGPIGVAHLLRGETGVTTAPTPAQLLAGTRAAPATLGLILLASANFVMVAVMAVAPVQLMGHGQDLQMIGNAIALHVAGMFAPSPVSGWLADRLGPLTVAAGGCVLLLLAGVAGAVVDPGDARAIMLVLAILGVGWNLAVVGGSTLITRSIAAELRVHVEGIGEVAMGAAAAAAAPAAGAIIAIGGFPSLSLLGAAIAATTLAAGARRTHTIRVA